MRISQKWNMEGIYCISAKTIKIMLIVWRKQANCEQIGKILVETGMCILRFGSKSLSSWQMSDNRWSFTSLRGWPMVLKFYVYTFFTYLWAIMGRVLSKLAKKKVRYKRILKHGLLLSSFSSSVVEDDGQVSYVCLECRHSWFLQTNDIRCINNKSEILA